MNFLTSSDFTFKCFGLTHSSSFFDVVKIMLFFERCLDAENDIRGDMYTFRYPKKGWAICWCQSPLLQPICVTWGFVSEFGNPPKPVLLQQGKHVGIQWIWAKYWDTRIWYVYNAITTSHEWHLFRCFITWRCRSISDVIVSSLAENAILWEKMSGAFIHLVAILFFQHGHHPFLRYNLKLGSISWFRGESECRSESSSGHKLMCAGQELILSKSL